MPHGGTLIDRAPTGAERESAIERAGSLPAITIGSVAASDLELIGNGAFSPLTGFMGEADYRSVVDTMRLANGLPWSIPITLAVGRDEADALQIGSEVALRDEGGRLLGILELAEKYTYDAQHEAEQVFRTTEDAHPGVARIYAAGEVYLGGDVTVLDGPADPPFATYRRTPAETRAIFAEKGWRRVVGFQTRNPIHRAHEYLTKVALEVTDGLMIHPLVGDTKSDDIPADVRMRAYETLLADYYPADRTLLSVYPGRHALRRPARGDLPRHRPQELRLHPLHRGARPCRRGQLLRHLRRAPDLRRVRPPMSWASPRSSSSTPSGATPARAWPPTRRAPTATTST